MMLLKEKQTKVRCLLKKNIKFLIFYFLKFISTKYKFEKIYQHNENMW